ncbi:acetyl-CoA carboxylase biotin carboxyl carrier protein subunit [Streptomyces sp. HNM0663]|uniref:Biotin carboxyl carrier protein of acetyl-CoA carboxylase n=1 Tax=Streptomyces chengmaiensis TaxID=3040919 RepID=A0ABT6HQ07_9ACTN|nr:biotin/lipoyl-containing protein [Streptomyces chengmaiensis]MDH2390810.1 acetyl-CoA carboxylase biotin carboxyl carrier protein subunit [Streptomyces chengmaiensis]
MIRQNGHNGRRGHNGNGNGSRYYGERPMSEVTKESLRTAPTDDPLAGLDYDTSALALTDICRSIADVVRVGAGHPRRVRVTLGAASVEVEWDEQQQTAAAAREPATLDRIEDTVEGHHECAPLVGTYYVAPSPGAPPFVRPGDRVEVGQQLGIIEAMKLMNPLEATRAGRVVEVLVADGAPVEYGQPLVLVDPEEPAGGAGED